LLSHPFGGSLDSAALCLTLRTLFALFCFMLVLLVADRLSRQAGIDLDLDLDQLGIVTWGVAWERYRSWMLVQAGHSEQTVHGYRTVLHDFMGTLPIDPATGQPRWGRMTKRHVERWLSQPARSGPRKGDSLSAATRRQYTSVLKTFDHWAAVIADPPLISKPRLLGLRSPKVHAGPPRNISDATLAEILAAAQATDLRMALMIWLAWAGGLRCKEIAAARIEDVYLDQDEITVYVHGKGDRDRLVPLHSASHSFVRGYLARMPRAGPLVEARDRTGWPTGEPMKPASVSAEISRWMRRNGFPVSAHQLRHTIATQMLEAGEGKNLLLIQAFLGHASINSTMTYVQGFKREVAEALEQVPNPMGMVGESGGG
jgi:site-specific recombinase XerD